MERWSNKTKGRGLKPPAAIGGVPAELWGLGGIFGQRGAGSGEDELEETSVPDRQNSLHAWRLILGSTHGYRLEQDTDDI